MADVNARARRFLALGLVALLSIPPVAAQARPAATQAGAAGPASPAASASPLFVVNDGRGAVTVIGEQASVREVVRILSGWFDFPGVDVQALPDTLTTMRFEREPVNRVVEQLLESAGVPARPVKARARRVPAARSSGPFFLVHDGRGLVTAGGDHAGIREVLGILSRWFDFPIVNLDVVPDVRMPVRFEGAPVAQVVDRLLRSASVNYVMLTNPATLVPTKVLAGARVASSVGLPPDPRAESGPAALIPILPGGRPAQPYPAPGGYDRPFRLEDLPVQPTAPATEPSPAAGSLQLPPAVAFPTPANPPGAPSAQTPKTPSASRPGVVVPAAPPTLPGGKPPGPPD